MNRPAVASEMRPYQSDLGENALLRDAIVPAYRSSNGSRTSNSLPLKRFHHQLLEKALRTPNSKPRTANSERWTANLRAHRGLR